MIPAANEPAQSLSTSHANVTEVARPQAQDSSADAALESPRFYMRTSYVDAHYSTLESDLQNGASTVALGLTRGLWSNFEGRALLELGHGMDQAVTIQNTRFITLRADATYLPLSGSLTPLAAFGLGYTEFDVKSERATSTGDTLMREHAKGAGALLAPALGGRLRVGSGPNKVAIDLTAEYLAIVGSGQTSALGGLTGALGLGLSF